MYYINAKDIYVYIHSRDLAVIVCCVTGTANG